MLKYFDEYKKVHQHIQFFISLFMQFSQFIVGGWTISLNLNNKCYEQRFLISNANDILVFIWDFSIFVQDILVLLY